MTPLEELPEKMPTETPQTDCEAVKKEWDAASKTGRVSAELMQKALECKLVPEDKVKGMPTGEQSMPPAPTREDNPLAADDEEDKELGMAELVMADDPFDPLAGLTPYAGDDVYNDYQDNFLPVEYVEDANGNWVSTAPDAGTGGGFDPLGDSFGGTGRPYNPSPQYPDGVSGTPVKGWVEIQTANGKVWVQPNFFSGEGTPKSTYLYTDKDGKPVYSDSTYLDPNDPKLQEYFARFAGVGSASYDSEGTGRIMNMPNYFSGQAPQKPDDMGNMEWHYRYGGGMYQNAFNPEQFYLNPDDKGNAGQTSSPYARIGNRGNMTPEIVQTNRPFYNPKGIEKYTNQDELKFRQRNMQMAESMPTPGDTPTGAAVDQIQGQSQQIDETMQEQIKEALAQAGFNVVDMELSPEGKILVSVGQFEDSYIENAQYFEQDFELAEPMNCKRRFKAIAVTPGMYKAKDGTLVELASSDLQKIATLFRNKPLVLVDHELARPDSTHEGRNVGYVEDSWYDENYDAVIYKGALNEDLDLASIAGSSIKLSHGTTPMGRHIALIPKCISGIACYAPQDPNAVILENAQHIRGDKMNITPEQAAAIKQELGSINKQKEKAIDAIIRNDIEAGELKDNIFDKSRDLWKKDVTTLLEMATVKDTGKKETPTTKGKVEGKKELSLAEKLEKGEIDEDTALEAIIKTHVFFK